MTAHVGWSGAGINLRTSQPSPSAIAQAVKRVLDEPGFRERTRALRDETRGIQPAVAASDLLEHLVAKRSSS